jgi:phosphatidylglycerol lysyltransferase
MKQIRNNKFSPELFVAFLIGMMGLVNLVSAVTPAMKNRLVLLERVFPLEVRTGTRLATAFTGFALIQLASGISRGKRTAWIVTLGILFISFFTHLIKGFDYEEASLTLALMVGLIWSRKRFQTISDYPTLRRGLLTLASAFLFTLLYGTTGLFILDRHFSISFDLISAFSQSVRMFTEFTDPGLIATTRFGRYFSVSIYIVGCLTMSYALLALLAPVVVHAPATEKERQQARKIIQKYGCSELARYCLFNDKRYFFSSGGSVLSYVYRNRVVMVLGDPIGPDGDMLSAIREFLEFCSRNDWNFAFYQTHPDRNNDYQNAGLELIKIGEIAIIDLADFSLQGSNMKQVRNAVNKVERLGFISQVSQPPHQPELLGLLQNISNEWLSERQSREMKYSMGWFDRDYLNTTPILYIVSDRGNPVAFVNLVDAFQKKELAVDLMRQKKNIPSGTMDYLFVQMLQTARDWGYDTFNLGLSGLAGVGESSDDAAIEKAMHFIYSRVSTTYNFRGLHDFKQKFNPRWEERYLVYSNITSLPAIAIALRDLIS